MTDGRRFCLVQRDRGDEDLQIWPSKKVEVVQHDRPDRIYDRERSLL